MPVFYGGVFISAPDSGFLENDSDASSDNPARADRLMQLINNIGVIQTDIAKENQRMDTLEEECRTKLDQLLKDRKIDTLQELEDKAMGKLTTEEKEEFNQAYKKLIQLQLGNAYSKFQQLIKATKTVAQVSDTMMWAGLLLSSDKMVKLGGKLYVK
ncbi:hypothetical protein C0991_009307 [Blastosporella zonata]|nr:hypothetical protein C0991_009307 [Blastosporella zonata]